MGLDMPLFYIPSFVGYNEATYRASCVSQKLFSTFDPLFDTLMILLKYVLIFMIIPF
jgi:hypothetical protein